ncbi:hypothetical protein Tco_1471782 [Tanacetum coccineum]
MKKDEREWKGKVLTIDMGLLEDVIDEDDCDDDDCDEDDCDDDDCDEDDCDDDDCDEEMSLVRMLVDGC